ncbi:MAG: hypothetical protein JWN94_3778 [Betaproteobacteria bacterium]|nr:hypothetical protein [Betaproteobacteria bacterium]
MTRLFVGWVNMRRVSLGENVARLEPGDQKLIVSCGIYVDHRFFTYDEELQGRLEANRVYRLRANPEGRRCQPYLEDVTGKSG